MRIGDAASDKPARAFSGKNALGLLFMAGGLILQAFWPRHTLQYGISFGLVLTGIVLWPSGKYLFFPTLLSLFAVLLSLGKNGVQTPSFVCMALAATIGLYGWWEYRKGKASKKRSD